ncbi:MAG: magnetic particle specific iron-binding protein, partial [Alphaproteobacteria bacterium]|nr:magnetic particle specific iron-binding protein [Alphaproteobacteria bacterium]
AAGAKGAGAATAKVAGTKAAGATVAKGAAVKTVAAKVGAGAAAAASNAGTVTAKGAASNGAILAGKGLGLGLGIGVWGPVALGIVGAAAVYGYLRSRKAENGQAAEEADLAEALA